MAIVINGELRDLEAQARGLRPFRRSSLYDGLVSKITTPEYMKLDAQTRLLLGYYLAAQCHAAELSEAND